MSNMGAAQQLYRELKSITDIYEAQGAIANNLEINEVLASIVIDACKLVSIV